MLKKSLIVLLMMTSYVAFAQAPQINIITNENSSDAPEANEMPTDTIEQNGDAIVINGEASQPQGSNLVEFNIIDNGTISGAKQDTAMLHVIEDNESWQAFWKKHMTVVPAPVAPVVDFETQEVLAIIDSDQPNSGYYIRLERIENQNGELWVHATREQPGPGCTSLGMVAQPYVIVTIDKTELPAKLLLSTRTYDC